MKKMLAKNTLIGMILIPAMFSGAVLAQGTSGKDPIVKNLKLTVSMIVVWS